jgi:hypothetical protein
MATSAYGWRIRPRGDSHPSLSGPYLVSHSVSNVSSIFVNRMHCIWHNNTDEPDQ